MIFSWPPGCHLLWVSSFPRSPCGSPHLPTRWRGAVSISKHPGLFLFSRLMGSHCGLTQGDGFGLVSLQNISSLLSASLTSTAGYVSHRGWRWDVLNALLCSGHFTKQEKKKKHWSRLSDIKCIVLWKGSSIIPDINPERTYSYYSRSQCKTSLRDFPHGPVVKNSPCNAGDTG